MVTRRRDVVTVGGEHRTLHHPTTKPKKPWVLEVDGEFLVRTRPKKGEPIVTLATLSSLEEAKAVAILAR